MSKDWDITIYSYRWVVLGVFMFIAALSQLLWITFAPITSIVADRYGVSDFDVAMLSLIFMIIYIPISIPAAWLIDSKGLKVGTGVGATILGIFGFLRIFAYDNFTLLLLFQAGIAISQPFILNSLTKISGKWFPQKERALATGIGTLSLFIGIACGMLLTPFLTEELSFQIMLSIYGIASLLGMSLFLLLAKPTPPTPPELSETEEKVLDFRGLTSILKMKDFLMLMALFFVGMGAFNAISTWIENIVAPRGFEPTDAGLIGGMMIFGGIMGSVILTELSDRYQKRKIFLTIAMGSTSVFILGLTFGKDIIALLILSFLLGFFLLPALPIGLQYAAERTSPVPEATSNGFLMLMGQIGGIILIIGMDLMDMEKKAGVEVSMIILSILFVLSCFMTLVLKEPGVADAS
ncbi:MAG: MFS transporter [Candidatus Thorarchaeota archaeon]